jgi:hypothetical protein
MKTGDRFPETELDRLLAGALPPADADRLRRELEQESQQLARDIRGRLADPGRDMPGVVPAPASLRARLRAIPGARARVFPAGLRWGLATTFAALLAVLFTVYQTPRHETAPTPAEVAQARAELAIAFSYLRQVSYRSEYYMRREIGHSMQDALNTGIFHALTGKLSGG